ncbi:MAG: hypothetical protein SGPRY_011216 [Prymnesium sp.]
MSNLYSLWRVGPLVEGLYGGSKTLLIYLLAGVGGNLAGLQWGALRSLSVGASGAVLGLMGAVAAYVMSNRQQLGRSGDALLTQVGQLLLLNLFIGLSPRSGIDNLGHFGGAATGFILGWLLSPRASRDRYSSGDDGIIPFSVTRVMLAATLVATALSLRAALPPHLPRGSLCYAVHVAYTGANGTFLLAASLHLLRLALPRLERSVYSSVDVCLMKADILMSDQGDQSRAANELCARQVLQSASSLAALLTAFSQGCGGVLFVCLALPYLGDAAAKKCLFLASRFGRGVLALSLVLSRDYEDSHIPLRCIGT